MRFQHLLPAFIGFFIVGVIIGLLVDGIGLGLILGFVIGLVATGIFEQFAQAGTFPQGASSLPGPPASIPTRAGGSTMTLEDILESEEAKKGAKAVEQPLRRVKDAQAVQDVDDHRSDSSRGLADLVDEVDSEPEAPLELDRDGDEPFEPQDITFEDSKLEEEVEEEEDITSVEDNEFDATITQELEVSQQGQARSTTETKNESLPDTTANRQPSEPSTGAQSPPYPHVIESEVEVKEIDEAGETTEKISMDPLSWLEELAKKQTEEGFAPESTSDRVTGREVVDGTPVNQPQSPPPPPPPKPATTVSKPDLKPSLDVEKEKSIDDEWVAAEETVEEQPPKEREEAPAVAAENVQFTLYHPKDAAAEQWYSLLTYIHVESAIQAVQADAKKFTAELTHDHREVRSRKSAKLTRGTEIRLVPHAEGLEFNPSSLAITWVEDFHRADFRFRANKDLIGEPILGELTVYVGPLEIANLRFSIFVTDKTTSAESSPETNSVQGEMYKRIFASYSHSDTLIVKACVAAFKAIGYDVLIDYETLRSGEDWNEALERLIDEADIFQLFWSSNAAQSKYVQQEWEYALKRPISDPTLKSGEGFIRPVYWEQPTPNIPELLAHIHFKYLADLANLDK